MKHTANRMITWVLFLIYLTIVTWIILFKFGLSLPGSGTGRSLNLIPFGASMVVNGKIGWDEIVNNLIVFVPFGVYVSMLTEHGSFLKRMLSAAGMSFLLELLQFVLAVGATDITDVISNTCGGVCGILIYVLLSKAVSKKTTLHKGLNILAGIGTAGLVSLLFVLMLMN